MSTACSALGRSVSKCDRLDAVDAVSPAVLDFSAFASPTLTRCHAVPAHRTNTATAAMTIIIRFVLTNTIYLPTRSLRRATLLLIASAGKRQACYAAFADAFILTIPSQYHGRLNRLGGSVAVAMIKSAPSNQNLTGSPRPIISDTSLPDLTL